MSWYNDTSKVKEVEKVKVGGQYVTQTNNNGEEVPILYTHDYILGTSDTGTSNTKPSLDENTHVKKLNGNCTQLSWERIDKLIWENLDKYLNYRDDIDNGDEVGLANRFNDISIFDKGTTYQADSSRVLSIEIDDTNKIDTNEIN